MANNYTYQTAFKLVNKLTENNNFFYRKSNVKKFEEEFINNEENLIQVFQDIKKSLQYDKYMDKDHLELETFYALGKISQLEIVIENLRTYGMFVEERNIKDEDLLSMTDSLTQMLEGIKNVWNDKI